MDLQETLDSGQSSHDSTMLTADTTDASTHQTSTAPARKLSTATARSGLSTISNSSHALQTQSDDSESIPSRESPAPPKPDSDVKEFHFLVSKCRGNKDRVEEIRTILRKHISGSTLTLSTDESGRTPLHLAAQRGDVQLATVLLEYEADIDSYDSEPATVLDLAITNKHRNFVALLCERGVDESRILDRNKDKFREMKQIIEFSKTAGQTSSKAKGRKSSTTQRADSVT